MRLFEAIPSELFSVLASPNRALYADALDVLYEAYGDSNLKIPESTYYMMLRGRLEQQLAQATFEDEDIEEEELRDISGRARFLIRKLGSKGWFEREREKDYTSFEEYLNIPGYSSRLLELLHQLRDDAPMRGYSYVFGTYSSLKVAKDSGTAYEKMMAVYSAYDNTMALIKMLKTVYHNVRRYFQIQIEMQDINEVLSTHFDDFGERVMEAYIRPLKIKDSVPKYRVPILTILEEWLEDDGVLLAMANAALQDKRRDTLEACRGELIEKIFWVKERYESIESDYLNEIDQQVRRYTRATTQKLENLANWDQNIRGNLNYLLTRLSQNRRAGKLTEAIQPAFLLYEQSFLSEKSLWIRKRPTRRKMTEPVAVEDASVSQETREQAEEMLSTPYSRAAQEEYIRQRFGEQTVLYSRDMAPEDDHAYIMCLLAVLNGGDRKSFYHVKTLDGSYKEGAYSIPQFRLERKEEKKDGSFGT